LFEENAPKKYIFGYNNNIINPPDNLNYISNEINPLDSEIKIELKIPGFNVPNNIRFVKGNLTLNEIEKTLKTEGEYIFERGMSIRNLNKTIFQLYAESNSILSFYLFKKKAKN
jgi:hypothetical protein